jgi:hypothetical protein
LVLRWGGPELMSTDASERSPAGHKVEDEHNDGEDKKDVNPTAQGVAADESYYPEDEKNNGDGPKHCRSPKRAGLVSRFAEWSPVTGRYLW